MTSTNSANKKVLMMVADDPIGSTFANRFYDSDPPSEYTLPDQIVRMIARRSHRKFLAKKVSDAMIEAITAAALSAPSKSDFQQATIIFIRSEEIRERFAKIIPANPWLASTPHIAVFCADTHRLRAATEMNGKPQENNDLEAFFNATVDAALVMQTFIIAAESLNLGCCPLSAVRFQMDQIGPLLKLPNGVFPVAALGFGHPEEQGHISMRLPQSVTVQTDEYDDRELLNHIKKYDDRRLRVTTGSTTPMAWSKAKTEQLAATRSEPFVAFLKKAGINLGQ
jgi:FMN reductase [NAD(P)H]